MKQKQIKEMENKKGIKELESLNSKNEEITIIAQRALKARDYAMRVKVKTDADEQIAIEAIASFINEWRRGENVRLFLTDPLNRQVKEINAKIKPQLDVLKDAENILRRKLADRHAETEKKAEDERARVLKRVENGSLSVETAVAKIENVPEARKTVRTEEATVTYREVRRVVMTDGDELLGDNQILVGKLIAAGKHEYLSVNTVKIREDALAGAEIPGVKVIIEKVPSVKLNSYYHDQRITGK